jgi:hypothetical protein
MPATGRGARGGILNIPRKQMSFLSSTDSCELAPLRVCELASILCVVVCFVLGYAKDAWQISRKFSLRLVRISAILDM